MFRAAAWHCWKCGREITVYTWDGHTLSPLTCPAVGRPASVQYVYSGTVDERYWANVCSFCGALQGDWYLYCEPDGPFCREQDGEDFYPEEAE